MILNQPTPFRSFNFFQEYYLRAFHLFKPGQHFPSIQRALFKVSALRRILFKDVLFLHRKLYKDVPSLRRISSKSFPYFSATRFIYQTLFTDSIVSNKYQRISRLKNPIILYLNNTWTIYWKLKDNKFLRFVDLTSTDLIFNYDFLNATSVVDTIANPNHSKPK